MKVFFITVGILEAIPKDFFKNPCRILSRSSFKTSRDTSKDSQRKFLKIFDFREGFPESMSDIISAGVLKETFEKPSEDSFWNVMRKF